MAHLNKEYILQSNDYLCKLIDSNKPFSIIRLTPGPSFFTLHNTHQGNLDKMSGIKMVNIHSGNIYKQSYISSIKSADCLFEVPSYPLMANDNKIVCEKYKLKKIDFNIAELLLLFRDIKDKPDIIPWMHKLLGK